MNRRKHREEEKTCQGNNVQTASQHYLPPWGMKPTVSDRRNLVDFHLLTRAHEGLLTRRRAALRAGQADISRTRSASFPTRVKDVLILVANSFSLG